MKNQQLYIKNEKGRYEPYKMPEPDISDTVYRKINGKYESIGLYYRHDYLSEGIWVVSSDRSFCNGKYIRDKYRLDKVSDLQYPTIAEMGGIESAIQQAWDELEPYKNRKLRTTGFSLYDGYRFVARRAIEILMEKQK